MKSKHFVSFNKIIKTLIFSFPALFNVLMLLMLIYFIFSILGVFLFKEVGDSSFQNFGVTFIELFRYSTGEDWHVGMYKFSENKPILGKIYFISYIFFSFFIMINMFVLIVIEQFENFYFNKENPINCFEDITDEFRKIWGLFCVDNGEKIKHGDVYNFFICLKSPMGYYVAEETNEDV